MFSNKIELLAPAATAAVGRAAIDAGADAVYIGGPRFGARAAAGNSLADIACLCAYAHTFGAKVYLALNTLVDDLEAAKQLAVEAHEAGVDAIIVQDMGLLALPRSIELHASTQCAVRTVERVRELADAGFSRVVLERGLSIHQIKKIIEAVPTVEYELFVHGAVCVSYSGECYLSEHLCGPARSANGGSCAQPCRSNYDLVDGAGRILVKNEPMLSPRDLNLSARLPEILGAGVCSLKIEGRLKDERYVVNTVGYYHQLLGKLGVERTSFGAVRHGFVPDVEKTFTRGFTEWFFDGKRTSTGQRGAPKGKFLGEIKRIEGNCIELDRGTELTNGDGAVSEGGVGLKINRAEGRKLFLRSAAGLAVGDRVYGTLFAGFRPSSVRRVPVSIAVTPAGLELDGRWSLAIDWSAYERAEKGNPLDAALRKVGGTPFEVTEVRWGLDFVPFMPAAEANGLRRALLGLYEQPRQAYERPEAKIAPKNVERGSLMGSPYCPLWEYGLCVRERPDIRGPFYLENNGRRVELVPLCGGGCGMLIRK